MFPQWWRFSFFHSFRLIFFYETKLHFCLLLKFHLAHFRFLQELLRSGNLEIQTASQIAKAFILHRKFCSLKAIKHRLKFEYDKQTKKGQGEIFTQWDEKKSEMSNRKRAYWEMAPTWKYFGRRDTIFASILSTKQNLHSFIRSNKKINLNSRSKTKKKKKNAWTVPSKFSDN